MSDDRRRPLADFFIMVREEPNRALAYGLGLIVLIAVAAFAVVRFAGGDDSKATSSTRGDDSTPTEPIGTTTIGTSGKSTTTTARGAHTTTTTRPAATTTTLDIPFEPPPIDPGGSSDPGSTRTSTPPQPLASYEQRWVTSPSDVTVAAGGLVRGVITVANLSDHRGTVQSPGCASSGTPMAVRRAPLATRTCETIRSILVRAHRSQHFDWVWHATNNGRSDGAPLAPGSYGFRVGPLTVHATVT